MYYCSYLYAQTIVIVCDKAKEKVFWKCIGL